MNPHLRRRVRRLGLAALTASVVVLGFTAPAIGIGHGPRPGPGPGPGNIDPDAPVTLTIHKYEQPDGTIGPNTGEEIHDPAGTPLDGVEFRVQRVTSIDLLTDTGWAMADGLTAEQVIAEPNVFPLGPGVSGRTNENGVLRLSSDKVGIGVYLVTETDPGEHQVLQAAVPFLVALPMPSPIGDGTWNTDVHVYPKNSLAAISKDVDDSTAWVLGDAVTWLISTSVPALPADDTYRWYQVSDQLDSRLGFRSAQVTLVDGTATELQAGTDYKLSAPGAGDSGTVKIEFTEAGLARLDSTSMSATVETVITTTVESIGKGSILNEATVFVNDPSTGFASTPAATHWGALRILKHAAADEMVTLAGAVFDVYAVDPGTPEATPVLTNVRTLSDGTAVIPGLKAGDYWIVETQAPAGYEKLAAPIPVTVKAGSLREAALVRVPNTQVPQFTLPLTGGSGALAFSIAGAALVLSAAGALIATRRHRSMDRGTAAALRD